jgi:uncharacterized membrane protein YfcA
MTWQLVLTGLLIGVLVGATGMGGGSLMTPILIFFFGFNPTVAVGTDIVHGAIFKSFGALRHRSLGTVQARLSGWMLIGSAPMSLIGVAAASAIGDRAESTMRDILGVTLVFGGVGLLAKAVVRFRETPAVPFVMGRRDRIAAIAIGACGGFVVGLTSVGSGVFFALTLLIVFPLRSQKVVGTDILHAAALLWVAGAGHLVAGNVDVSTVAWLLVGSIPGVLVGSHLSIRLSDRTLKLVLAALLGISGLKLLGGERGNALAAAAVLVVIVAVVGSAIWSRRRSSRGVPVVPASRGRDSALFDGAV